MQNHQEIIETYRRADFEHRLSLFLEYPSFRTSFVRIDHSEYKREAIPQQNSVKLIIGRCWKNMWARGLLKF